MNKEILLTLDQIEGSILLNEGVLDALDWPKHIQVYFNQNEKMLLLKACSLDDQQAVVMPEEHALQFEISGRSLIKKIKHLVGWTDALPRLCRGEYLPAHQAVRFHLTEAQPVDLELQ